MSAEEGPTVAAVPQDVSDVTQQFGRLSTGDAHPGEHVEAQPRTEDEYANEELTLRAIVSSKEAGVIIGKAGKNVADLRDETGVRAGVSKVVPGVHDRVLTVQGRLVGIAKAYRIVAKGLLEGAPHMGMGGLVSSPGTHRKSFPLSLSLVSNGRDIVMIAYLLVVCGGSLAPMSLIQCLSAIHVGGNTN
jgi:heterogeneous nuclear rnp K-like protein